MCQWRVPVPPQPNPLPWGEGENFAINAIRISNCENRMNNRQSPIPKGHATIAQRFNVGLISNERSSPEGTAETAREPSAVPSGLTTGYLTLPNVKTLGYCRASLRDEEQIVVALELCHRST